MKIIAQTRFVLSAMVLILISACTESTPIGADLLEQDQSDIRFTDTITIRTSTITEDSVRTFDPNPEAQFDSYLCGNYTDPVFGSMISDLYVQFRNSISNPPDFTNTTIDSLVLKMEYDTIYGNPDAIHNFEVFQINEFIPNDTTYYSDRAFAVDNQVIGSKMFRAAILDSDSLFVRDFTIQDSILIRKTPPHLRINLSESNPALTNLLTSLDSMDYTDSESFISAFNGLYIKAVSSTQSMLSFNLTTETSGLTIYYKTPAGENAQYEYSIFNSNVKHTNFRHDFSGTPIQNAFNDQSIGDSILYLQGASGPNIEVDFPFATTLRNQIIVNKAELTFTIATPIDEAIFKPVEQLILTRRNDDGVLVVIPDVLFALTLSELDELFGGTVTTDNGLMLQTYTMNISAHLQNIIEGDQASTVILRAFPKQELGSRVILYGPGHSKYPTTLKLTYTKLNQ